ncbi:MAG: hypothetical protein HC860_13685 [Alkalinema sp. RU_4_3]|nr:hypothetical protein [Alkalinema sp. RU_4_3]NJR71410.1 hypothetical protein [Synechococcales cyanobacterium CRU_2_2]
MTRTEKTELHITFDANDRAQAHDYEFTHSGALAMLDRQGNCVSVGFSPDHIPAIEQLLTILYAYRGDYDDVMTPIAEPMAA